MKQLYFMRHGLTVLNLQGIRAGSTETPLTEEGRAQAKAAAQIAKELGVDTIAASTMGRTKETAQIVAKELGFKPEDIHYSSLLVERNFGALEGQPYMPDTDMDGIADIETTDELFTRAQLALRWLNSLPGDNVLVVSHGAFGRALRHVINPTIPFHGAGHFKNAEIALLENI